MREKYLLRIESDVDKINEIAEYWGDQMPMMAMEELGECIQAISEIERVSGVERFKNMTQQNNSFNDNRKFDKARKNLIDEIADVHISLMALLGGHYGITAMDINNRIKEKTSMKK